MIAAHRAFDVQTTLSRVTRLRVDTRKLDDREVLFTIGFSWDLVLDEDDLRKLHNATDSDSEFKAALEELKPRCLIYNTFRANR